MNTGIPGLDRELEKVLLELCGQEELDRLMKEGRGKEDEAAIALLRDEGLDEIFGKEEVRIAVVGTANVGKSSLLNALFGEKVVAEGARADVTDQITRVRLPSSLVLYDTPGLAGLDDENEEITRAYLGLPPYRTAPEAIPMCCLDADHVCRSQRVHPSRQECVETLACEKALRFHPGSPELEEECPHVVIHLVSLRSGLRQDDKQSSALLARYVEQPIITVGNFLDSVRAEEDLDQALLGARRVIPDIVGVDSETLNGIKGLVKRVIEMLPTAAKISVFNQAIERRFQASRDELFSGYVARVAAKAALASTRKTVPRFEPDPKHPDDDKKKKEVKLTRVDLFTEALAVRIMLDFMVDEETWSQGRAASRIGEMLARQRDRIMAALSGGITTATVITVLCIAAGMAGNLGFYLVAAVVLGWFGLGGAAWMVGIAAVGGPIVVIPASAMLLGMSVFGLTHWLRPGRLISPYGGYAAVKQVYTQAFLLRRQLIEAERGVVDAFGDDEKRMRTYVEEMRRYVDRTINEVVPPHRSFVWKKMRQFRKDADDATTRKFIEAQLFHRLSAIAPTPYPSNSKA